MLDEKLISELQLSLEELDQLFSFKNEKSKKNSSIKSKKENTIASIVNYFYEILSYFFLSGQNYWDFISKHINGPVTTFCLIYENSFDESEIEDFEKQGYKKDILNILEKLNNFKFNNNINNEVHHNYLKYLKDCGQNNQAENQIFSIDPILRVETSIIFNEEEDDIKDFMKDFEKYEPKSNKGIRRNNEPEEFEFTKFADFRPNIDENFYNFTPKVKSEIKVEQDEINSNIILDSVNNEEFQFKDLRKDSGLKLNNDTKFRNLPSEI